MDFDPKHITGQLLRAMGAFGIVLTPILPLLAVEAASLDQKHHIVRINRVHSRLESKQNALNPNDFNLYDSDQFSIHYPKDWQVTFQDNNRVDIVSSSPDPIMDIRTEVSLLREDPDTVVPQRLDQIVASGVVVNRYSLITVNGYSGFRVWSASADDRQTLTTFIGYADQQTAILTSRYTGEAQIEDLVTTIHNSFVNHSVDPAVDPVEPVD